MSDLSTKSLALSSFTRPVYYSKDSQFICDANNNIVLELRAWGMLQYQDGPEERQDAIGEMVAALINGA